MKTAKYVIVAMGLVLLLSSCFMSNPWLGGGEGDSVYLPPDVIKDTTRSGSEPFQFETLLPVALNLEIDFYEKNSTGPGSNLTEIAPAVGKAIVVVTNGKGNVVYEGAVQADGTLDAKLVLPADPEEMVLTVKAHGYQDRSVKISDLVKYSTIDRKMGLMSEGLSAKDDVILDSDNDLVPDLYDAFPFDPDYAFELRYPDTGFMTVAYEDLYLRAAAGDADYNDFLAKYAITEKTKVTKEGKTVLSSIEGEITAEVKLAGYDHLFGIAFAYKLDPGEVLDGTFTLTYFGSDGGPEELDPATFDLADLLVPIPEPNDSSFTHKVVVPLFGSTAAATAGGKKSTARFEADLTDNPIDRDKIQLAPYDPFLYVWNTFYDIHLIGEEPLSAIPHLPGIDTITQLKSGDTQGPYTFMDSEGFPWALLVPIDWEHPPETVRIENVYPFFENWRLSQGASNTNWYLYEMDPTNQPPGVPTVDPDSLEFDRTDRTPQETNIDITLGTDPDGDDPVTLHWTVPPSYVEVMENTVDPESHKLIVDFPEDTGFTPPEELNLYFWCEDAEGARSEFTQLNISFVEPAKEYTRLIIDTYKPTGSLGFGVVYNAVDLYRAGADDTIPPQQLFQTNTYARNPIFSSYARFDYDSSGSPFVSGTKLYIRVSGRTPSDVGAYAVRVITDVNPTPVMDAQYPPVEDWFFTTPNNADVDSITGAPYEPDDATNTAGNPVKPVPIVLNGKLNRYLRTNDADWFELVLP